MTKALVVDDSQFMRTVIGNILSEHGYDVTRASDGAEAVEAVQEHEPDLVTMDVNMPGMDGIEAVERIMEIHPTKILMLSAHTREGADETFEALARGAVDFFPKHGGEVSTDIEAMEQRLVEKIEAVERADVTSVAAARAQSAVQRTVEAKEMTEAAVAEVGAESESVEALGDVDHVGQLTAANLDAATDPASIDLDGITLDSGADTDRILDLDQDGLASTYDEPDWTADTERSFVAGASIVIGASTGGPRTIEQLVQEFPPSLDAKVLVVQHMPASFTDRLARRLDQISPLDVREASDGARVEPGEVLVAKGGYHMEVTSARPDRLRVELTERPRLHGVRPAIDVTMATLAERDSTPLVGVALTGMGRDGARGISAIKGAGGTTIVQDEETSPVFGIPRQAIATGDVDHVVPGPSIVDCLLETLADDGDTEDGDTEDGDIEDGDIEDGDIEDGDIEDGDTDG